MGTPLAPKDEGAGAPENDAEVTPAMIEAGVGEIVTYNLDHETREDAVRRIFEAMIRARKDWSPMF